MAFVGAEKFSEVFEDLHYITLSVSWSSS